jgi:ferric-dicitrate binding protein FerR (iron transport regulator)
VRRLPPGSLERLIGWTTGALIFDNISLRRAATDIEHQYGVRIDITDSLLAKRPVTARFHGEPAAQVLDAIALALGAHSTASGTTFTLSPGRR